jgi:hypothetical protein
VRAAVVLIVLGGCDWLRGAKDTVEDAVDPLVAVGVVERVEAPAELPEGVELPPELQAGNGATIFLADARDAGHLADAPVAGASLVLDGCGDEAELTDGGDGSYAAAGVLAGCEGPFEVDRVDDPPAVMPITLPQPQDPGIGPTWTAGTDMVLDLSGADWNGAVIVVANLSSGEVTWTSKPDGIVAWYQLLEGQQDLSAVTIPGSAFEDDSLHAVAVTGLLRTKKGQLDGVNTLLSTVDGGRTTLHVVSTVTAPGG